MRRELGVALVQVRRAAAVVRLQAEDVRVRLVVVPGAGIAVDADLVDLLVVLVRPSVGREGRRQRVVGDALPKVADAGLAGHGEHALEGVERLHHRAGLRALRGVCAGEVLVPREHAVGHAVEARELLPPRAEGVRLLGAAVERVLDLRGLQRHGQVHHVRALVDLPGLGPGVLRGLEARLQHGPGVRALLVLLVGEGVEVARPIHGLTQDLVAELEQPRLARDVVEPQDRVHAVARARDGPQPQGLLVQLARHVGEVLRQKDQDFLVARDGEILLQGLEHDHARPPVGVVLRAKEALLVLGGEDPVHKAPGQVL